MVFILLKNNILFFKNNTALVKYTEFKLLKKFKMLITNTTAYETGQHTVLQGDEVSLHLRTLNLHTEEK